MSSRLLAALARTDEQALLADAAGRFVRERYAYRDWRAIVDGEPGMCSRRWSEMAALGWLGIGLPEAEGGFGSLCDALQVVESLATGLAAEPLASTVLVCADLLAQAGSETQRAQWLPALIAGGQRWAYAHDEREPALGTRAKPVASGWQLDGDKWLIADAPHADQLILSACIEGDAQALGLFVIPGNAAGLAQQALRGFDRRRLGNLSLRRVSLPRDALLGETGRAPALVERARRRQLAALAAEATGLGATLLGMTREYLSGREQFGVKLATFQVLQHRLVDMAIALEELRTATRLAAIACEAGADAQGMVAAAAITVARTARLIGRQAVQLHGGMGMTDELPVGDYMKRLEAIALRVGPDDANLDRIAGAFEAVAVRTP